MALNFVEYVWLDGKNPTQNLRSKSRVVSFEGKLTLNHIPDWGFDGSSTYQASGGDSDCLLKPVCIIKNTLKKQRSYVVLCEVFNADGSPHVTNQRAKLRELISEVGEVTDPYAGFEQEYTFFKGRDPLGWPNEGYPAPQGPFYCGVGSGLVFGRKIVEEHFAVCAEAGICIYGVNAEVMPGQWEFQVGPRGIDGEKCDPLTMSDHLWLSRYFMHAIAEKYGVSVSFSNKPIKGDWNGAGMHTNFSTQAMRDVSSGMNAIEEAVAKLGQLHSEHITKYGEGLGERLTGSHETCKMSEFKSGVSDRGASIRIPMNTAQKGYGYIEDRRPGANADPYVVSICLLESICI